MFFKVFKKKIAKIFFFTFLVRNRKSARAPHLIAAQQPFDAHCITIICAHNYESGLSQNEKKNEFITYFTRHDFKLNIFNVIFTISSKMNL